MDKTQLVNRVSDRTGFSNQVTAMVATALIDEVAQTLARGGQVTINGFGVFGTRMGAPRTGRNPQTNEEVPIPARRRVVFRASPVLQRRVQGVDSGEAPAAAGHTGRGSGDDPAAPVSLLSPGPVGKSESVSVVWSAIAVALAALAAWWGLKMILAAIGLQFNSTRGGIINKAVKRFKKGIIWFVVVLTVVGLIAYYVTPSVMAWIATLSDGIANATDTAGAAISTAGPAIRDGVLIVLGLVVALVYWAYTAVWADRARTRDGRTLRLIGAGIPFAAVYLSVLYIFFA